MVPLASFRRWEHPAKHGAITLSNLSQPIKCLTKQEKSPQALSILIWHLYERRINTVLTYHHLYCRIVLMNVTFANDDLDRLEIDPHFTANLSQALVKAF